MDEFRLKGIVINSIDYKDNDKLITLYTLELGKITATLKGVKNKNAKLKFAGQLFCFAEFVLVKRGEFYTVISADQIESFYELTADYIKFLSAQAMVELVNLSTMPNQINENFFLQLIRSLTELLSDYDDVAYMVLIKFFLLTFAISGYALSFDNCPDCGGVMMTEPYFNFDMGNITCKNCRGFYYSLLSKEDYGVLKLINNTDINHLNTIKLKNYAFINLVAVMSKNFTERFNKTIKTIKNLLIA